VPPLTTADPSALQALFNQGRQYVRSNPIRIRPLRGLALTAVFPTRSAAD